MADSREQRDELLLDLGALVFECHRSGRRAPDLLSAKAAELDALGGMPSDGAEAACSHCGAAAPAQQLVCLECGGRIALHPLERAAWVAASSGEPKGEPLTEPRPPKPGPPPTPSANGAHSRAAPTLAVWNAVGGPYPPPDAVLSPRQRRWPHALAGLTVAAVVAAATLGVLKAVDGNGSSPPHAAAGASSPRAKPGAVDTPARPARAEGSGGVSGWSGGSAYTVVLLTTDNAKGARQAAERLQGQEVRAGVVRNGSFWLVFSGRYHDQSAAAADAARLRERLGAAYVQFIER